MQRLSNGSQVAALPVPAALSGAPGYATGGNPQANPVLYASEFDADQYNRIQEEICSVILGSGLALDPTNNGQLLAAIGKIRTLPSVFAAESGWCELPCSAGTLILNWGSGTTGSTGIVDQVFPIAFPNACMAVIAGTTGSTGYSYCLISAGVPATNNCPIVASNLSSPGTSGGNAAYSYLAIGY